MSIEESDELVPVIVTRGQCSRCGRTVAVRGRRLILHTAKLITRGVVRPCLGSGERFCPYAGMSVALCKSWELCDCFEP